MNRNKGCIGVFDSGLGGISVLRELVRMMPNEKFVYYGDSGNAPYGTKNREEIQKLCVDVCDFLVNKGAKAIVIACNTATSAAADMLRERYKGIHIIGMEPALKPAVENKNGGVVVMATPFTLKEAKFNNLVDKFAVDVNIVRMPCPELVKIVENDELVNEEIVSNQLKEYYEKVDLSVIKNVVLGCTHFVFYKDYLKDVLGNDIEIIDGNLGTAKNLFNVLKNNNILNNGLGSVEFYNSQSEENKHEIGIDKLELGIKLYNLK